MVMDSLSGIRDPLPDVAAAERAGDARRQVGGRPKGTARRRPKKGQPEPATASGDGSDSHVNEEGEQPPQTSPDRKNPTDDEISAVCYGKDKTIAPTMPSKGRLIDIAI